MTSHHPQLWQLGRQRSKYLEQVHMQDAAQLKQFLQSNQPMLLVSCNNRAEKSLFLSSLMSHCDPQKIFFRLKGRPNFHSTLLPEIFSMHWAIQCHSMHRKKTHISFDHILTCLKTHRQHCLLIVEQAHLLPLSVLGILCRLAHHQEKNGTYIQIVLLGYPEIMSTVNELYLEKFNTPEMLRLCPVKKIKAKTTFSAPIAIQRNFSAVLFILFASGFLWWKTQASGVLSFSLERSIPIFYYH